MTKSNNVNSANKANGKGPGLELAESLIKKYPALIGDLSASSPYFDTFRNLSESYSTIAHSEPSNEDRKAFHELIEAIETNLKTKKRRRDNKLDPTVHPEIKIQEPDEELVDSVIDSHRERGHIVYGLSVDNKNLMVVDPYVKAAYRVTIAMAASENGMKEAFERKGEYLIYAYFENVKVYNSMIPGKARKIELDVTSPITQFIAHLGPSTERELVSSLSVLGLIPDRTKGPENLTTVINAYIQAGKAEQLSGFDTPGFYKNTQDNGISVVGYQLKDIPPEELHKALVVLDKVVHLFPEESRPRVSVSVKWNLTAPFHYYMKQRHMYPKGILLYGPSGTAKTAMLTISHGIWGIYDGSMNHGFFIPGSAANTEARLAKAWELGTLPLIIDEADPTYLRSDIHENTPVIAMLKHGMQSTESRSTFDKGVSLALASIGMTANKKPPAGSEALLNRLDMYESSRKEVIRASTADKARFQELQNELYPQLESIGQWVAHKIIENPDLLNPDYVTLGENLLSLMYREDGIEVPEWIFLRPQVSSVENNDVDIAEQIRSFLLKSHLEDYSRNSPKEYLSAEERVNLAIRSGFSHLAIFKNTKGIEQVIFTTAFSREISRIAGEAYNLQSVGDLLGFEYKVSWVNGKSNRTLVVKLEDYLIFLFPEFEDNDLEEQSEDKPGKLSEDDPEKIRQALKGLKRSADPREKAGNGQDNDELDHSHGIQEADSGNQKVIASTDPIIKLLIDCTYNSSKKYKTVSEVSDCSLDPEMTRSKVYSSLEELVKHGKVVKNGSSYAARIVLEGNA